MSHNEPRRSGTLSRTLRDAFVVTTSSAIVAAGCYITDAPPNPYLPPPMCPTELPIAVPCAPSPRGDYPFGCTYEVETSCGLELATADCIVRSGQQVVWFVVVQSCPTS